MNSLRGGLAPRVQARQRRLPIRPEGRPRIDERGAFELFRDWVAAVNMLDTPASFDAMRRLRQIGVSVVWCPRRHRP